MTMYGKLAPDAGFLQRGVAPPSVLTAKASRQGNADPASIYPAPPPLHAEWEDR
jgi:hypothetical protein